MFFTRQNYSYSKERQNNFKKTNLMFLMYKFSRKTILGANIKLHHSKPLPFHLRRSVLPPLNTSVVKPQRQSNSQGSTVCFWSINHWPPQQFTATGEAWICSGSHVKNCFPSVGCVWDRCATLIWDLLIKDYFFPPSSASPKMKNSVALIKNDNKKKPKWIVMLSRLNNCTLKYIIQKILK